MSELIPLNVAQQRASLSKNTLRKLLRERKIMLYENPRDRREKLVDWAEVEAALRPRPLGPAGERGSRALG
ncbi:MAG TPA: hypothetical protein VFI42_12830 [Thermomicrobiaceae bacterium]|nr:hypothetical protein [Thermomicrobiaceae bacterium]